MVSLFPDGLDLLSTSKGNALGQEGDHPAHHNALAAAVNAIEAEVRGGGRVFNVRHYGAAGDGASNDTAAVQAAITAASVAGGGEVFFPNGTYMINNTLTNAAEVHWRGQGMYASTIKLMDGVNVSNSGVAGSNKHMVRTATEAVYRDLRIDGNKANNAGASPAWAGVYGDANRDNYFIRTRVQNCYRGIDIVNTTGQHLLTSYLADNVHFGALIPTDSLTLGCFAGGNGAGHGQWNSCNFHIAGWDARVIGNHVWNGDHGIVSTYAQGALVLGNNIEENFKSGIYCDGWTQDWMVLGNQFERNGRGDLASSVSNTYDTIVLAPKVAEHGHRNTIAFNGFSRHDGTSETPNARYCVAENAQCYDNLILGNMFTNGYLTGAVNVNNSPPAGARSIVRNNHGWKMTASGLLTIPSGNTSAAASHGLNGTPDRVQLTPTADTAGKRYWVSAKAASTFTVTLDSSHGSDISFDWRAVVGEDVG